MGARGFLSSGKEKVPTIPIIAPDGFTKVTMNENVTPGPALRQRANFRYGKALAKGPEGQIGIGLGMGTSVRKGSLTPINKLVKRTEEAHVAGGVKIAFQVVPETEAPAQKIFWFLDFRALCVPETAESCGASSCVNEFGVVAGVERGGRSVLATALQPSIECAAHYHIVFGQFESTL
ncbi:uncharacterized protein BDR25DRAFT_309869 [Lindgomyces ingoldianus]|uniref:Uncharacterized protein n=1 Tax=Lindgomyces ingoldianus TaxID=673940 RepID=A0ACB6RDC8_9PLEO|nr:uncharacterized protein BDR25DRAFT_309869 [Lindgomyces ingoldianus]KAF2476481.1 hypothetical protein BDR25DRAFT_309869 [Lindgomyces ingoldianus]